MRLMVAVVAFEAELFIEGLLDRIPTEIAGARPTILVADDASTDRTADVAQRWADADPSRNVEVVVRASNLGYGGNQRACYEQAAADGYDLVALVHGDAQYPPERLGLLVEAIGDRPDRAAFGSRMIVKGDARRGGMPLDRYMGNRVISGFLNMCTGAELTEWFSGYRLYRVDTLSAAGLDRMPPGFDFDTAIMFRLLEMGVEIVEVPMPTKYGDEVSRVPLLRTGLAAMVNGARAATKRLGASTRGLAADRSSA